ncbi:MAG: hypothetical protein EOO15_07540 [Chitinophagaceae bacterium]|nr:MAG: hypothetical protein EOO15_07540 [Chitinophagaceae bacterium]
MKSISSPLFGAFLLLCSLATSAQRNWRPAYIVNRDGDTLTGQVDDRRWSISPQTISFRVKDADAVEYGARDLNALSIEGGDYFAIVNLLVDDAPVELNALVDIAENRQTNRRVFLRRLYAGRILSLYELQELSKSHFVIEDSTHAFTELAYRVGYSGTSRNVETRRGFRNQLYHYVIDKEGALANEVREANYSMEDLLRIVPKLNGAEELERSDRRKVARGVRLNAYVGGGVSYNHTFFESTPTAFIPSTSATNVVPLLAAGIELSEQNRLQHFFLRLGFSYNQFSYTGSVKLPTTELQFESKNIKTFRAAVSLNYQHKFGPLQAYIGPGCAYQRTRVERTNLRFIESGDGVTPQVGAGIRYGHILVGAEYLFEKHVSTRTALFFAAFRF